jgi:hypothetical protein
VNNKLERYNTTRKSKSEVDTTSFDVFLDSPFAKAKMVVGGVGGRANVRRVTTVPVWLRAATGEVVVEVKRVYCPNNK